MTSTNSPLNFTPASLDVADADTPTAATHAEPGQATQMSATRGQQSASGPTLPAVLGRLTALGLASPNTTPRVQHASASRRTVAPSDALRRQAIGQFVRPGIRPLGAAPTNASVNTTVRTSAPPQVAHPNLLEPPAELDLYNAGSVQPQNSVPSTAPEERLIKNWNSLGPLEKIDRYNDDPLGTPKSVPNARPQQVLTEVARALGSKALVARAWDLKAQDPEEKAAELAAQTFDGIIMNWSWTFKSEGAIFLAMLAGEAAKALPPFELQFVHDRIIDYWPVASKTKGLTACLTARLIDDLHLTADRVEAFSRLVPLCAGEPKGSRPSMSGKLFEQLRHLPLEIVEDEDEDDECADQGTYFFNYAKELPIGELRSLVTLMNNALKQWPEGDQDNHYRAQQIAERLERIADNAEAAT